VTDCSPSIELPTARRTSSTSIFRRLAAPFIIPGTVKTNGLRAAFDIEADGLLDTVTKIHCIVVVDLDSNQVDEYGPGQITAALDHLKRARYLTGHNIQGYDLELLRRLHGWTPAADCIVIDTLVTARLILPNLADLDDHAAAIGDKSFGKLRGRYSIEAWGERLGIPKTGTGIENWAEWTPEMQERCAGDTLICKALWRFLQPDGYSQDALALEHRVAAICDELTATGVPFDLAAAEQLRQQWTTRRAELEAHLLEQFPGVNLNSRLQLGRLLVPQPTDRFLLPPCSSQSHKHLARGALELLAGAPTVGKSQIQCQYVACATTGRDWPNGAPGIIPCRVIMLTAEDNTDDTLVPRLVAAGADLSRIKELKAIRRNGKEELFLLGEDLAALEQMINDWGDVGLVTIDPITAYMGHAKHFDSHRATDVRSQLSPLKVLAERTGVAISAVTHPPKNVGQRALDHFIGSQAFIAAARLGHLCIEEMTEDTEGGVKQPSGRYLFTDAKPSIKARQPTLTYRIGVVETEDCDPDTDEPIEAPVIRWEGESELSADEAIAASRPTKTRGPSAQGFLNDILAGGRVLQKTVIERGASHGFSYKQLWRAKDALGVVDFREKGVQAGPSYWALPQHAPE
jgi:hypothetical protein